MKSFKEWLEESDNSLKDIKLLLKAYKDNNRITKFNLESVKAGFKSDILTVEINRVLKGYGVPQVITKKYELEYTTSRGVGFATENTKVNLDDNILNFLGMMKLQPRYYGDRALCFDQYGKYGITSAKFKKLVIIVNTDYD